MVKKVFCTLLIMSMCLLLTSCKMSDYNEARDALSRNNFKEAITIFAELGDYNDSQYQLLKAIEGYAAHLSKWHNYDELISLYQQYSYVSDFSVQEKNAVIDYSDYLRRCLKYADSVAIYTQYSYIADFSIQQQEAIEKYVNELLDDNDYSTAISVYKRYSSVADYSLRISELQSEKELYDVYYNAMSLLKRGRISEGFAVLETLPQGYRSINKIYTSYEKLKDSRFTGSHRMNNPHWTNSQKVDFSLVFLPEYECFCIQAYLTVYWSDGTVYSRDTYYGYADDLKDNTLRTGKYKWVMNENGKIVDW